MTLDSKKVIISINGKVIKSLANVTVASNVPSVPVTIGETALPKNIILTEYRSISGRYFYCEWDILHNFPVTDLMEQNDFEHYVKEQYDPEAQWTFYLTSLNNILGKNQAGSDGECVNIEEFERLYIRNYGKQPI